MGIISWDIFTRIAKMGIQNHNDLGNIIFRKTRLIGLNPILEIIGLLPDDPNYRSIDIFLGTSYPSAKFLV